MKCSYTKCKQEVLFKHPDYPKTVFCEDHAIDYLKKSDVSLLPRI